MLFLMDLPKPVHGMSTINKAVIDASIQAGLKADVINTAPSYGARWFGRKPWQILKMLHTVLCYFRLLFFLLLHRRPVVYRSIYGGSGLWYDTLYIAICRLFNARLFIHHHSFNYINTHSQAFNIVQRLAGPQAIHIVLGADMAQLLGQRYAITPSQLRVLSNLAFFSMTSEKAQNSTQGPVVIGHLANLCFEKGLDTFIELCKQLQQRQIPFEAYLAGPAMDDDVKATLNRITREMRNVHYLGPVYDSDKVQFYKKLDAFIFPTRYHNEAEPLVLYEAATHGALLIGTQRGCMRQVIETLGGHSLPETVNLPEAISAFLIDAQEQNLFDLSNRHSRTARFSEAQQQSRAVLQQLLSELNHQHVPET